MRYLFAAIVLVSLSGCAGPVGGLLAGLRGAPAPRAAAVRPAPAPRPPAAPPADARRVEDFVTSTPEARAAALDPAQPADDGRLGVTVASLGDPGDPGFWLKTPLVSETRTGRVFYAKSGRYVRVTLIPSGGAAGGGSQISLEAMRLLDAPLTGLPELVVYAT